MNQEKMGKLIAKIRKEKGLTQDQLGQKLGVSSKAVSKWECGLTTPDISIINELSDILGITTRELLEGKQRFDKNRIKNVIQNIKKMILNNKIISVLVFLFIIIFIALLLFFL